MSDRLTGRELDAAVAVECFGKNVKWIPDHSGTLHPYLHKEFRDCDYGVGYYSTRMGDAWLLIIWAEQQGADYIDVEFEDGQWCCRFTSIAFAGTTFDVSAYADTPEEAICYAVLELARHLKGAGNDE